MKLIVATNNAGKLAELRALLPASVDLISLCDAGLESPEETGSTFLENARIKARAAARRADGAIADDSGLEVDALGGAPGVRSARYSGPDATDEENNQALLAALQGTSATERRARFVSAVVLTLADGREWHGHGEVTGNVIDRPRGSGGFGYDTLFEIDDPDAPEFGGRTMAELSRDEKNQISHRARAYAALFEQLRDQGVW